MAPEGEAWNLSPLDVCVNHWQKRVEANEVEGVLAKYKFESFSTDGCVRVDKATDTGASALDVVFDD